MVRGVHNNLLKCNKSMNAGIYFEIFSSLKQKAKIKLLKLIYVFVQLSEIHFVPLYIIYEIMRLDGQ